MRFAVVLFSVSLFAGPKVDPITPANVARLKIAWTYDTGEAIDHFRRDPRFEATPVYDNGKLYVSTPGGLIVALDAETGRVIWKTDLHVSRDRNYSDFANRGVTLGGDTIFVGTADARLVAIDCLTGRLRPGFAKDGTIELTEGLRRKPRYDGEYGVSSPPAFYRAPNGREFIIVGSFVADNSRANMASGEVRAFDAKTGALAWTFHPLPENSPAGAANTWSRIVADPVFKDRAARRCRPPRRAHSPLRGLRSFSQLKEAATGFLAVLEREVDGGLLNTIAPTRLRLPGGRQTKVHYDRGKPPWIASRLQDFFGMRETPRVAGGKVALVVQLLAPSQRPVQTSTDLAGFWERLYPQLRKELGRRYPKHKWPEDPYSAA